MPKSEHDLLFKCMTQLRAMGNNCLMFVVTHKCATNALDTRTSWNQSRDLDLGSLVLSLVHDTTPYYR